MDELKIKQDLVSYQTQFKNIKNRLVQHYPDYINTEDKKGFKNAQSALNSLYNNLTILEAKINAQMSSNSGVIKNANTNIRVSKSKYMSDIKNLTTSGRVNAASDELKLDKYNENVEEYLKTFFSLFGIVLMLRFVRL